MSVRGEEARVRDAAQRLGEHSSNALIRDARDLLARALDGCWCDDGSGAAECQRCVTARVAWNELGKLEGAS